MQCSKAAAVRFRAKVYNLAATLTRLILMTCHASDVVDHGRSSKVLDGDPSSLLLEY